MHPKLICSLGLICSGFLLFGAAPARAELPPAAYDQMQAEAPEILRIQILKLEVKLDPVESDMELRHVTITAKAVYVRRSKAGLKRGDTIKLSYENLTPKRPGWAGPAPIPVLKAKSIYRAFLEPSEDGSTFAPAAKGRSFELVTDEKK